MQQRHNAERDTLARFSLPHHHPLPSAHDWPAVIAAVTHAFQPIVQLRTGRCHGFEALMRGWDAVGFPSIAALLDAAHDDGWLARVETALHAKALDRFRSLSPGPDVRLFLNVDARLLGTTDALVGVAADQPVPVVHEVSEARPVPETVAVDAVIDQCRSAGIAVALDDFGIGFAGLKLLYETRPDFVKIDRFFVAGIDRDLRKRAIVSYLVGYAHALGIVTVAEGIETAAEFYTCRDIGCDFGQGYLLGRPETDPAALPRVCAAVETLNGQDRRQPSEARTRLIEVMDTIPPLRVDSPKATLLEYFANLQAPLAVPVVDAARAPVGLIRERDLKPFVYSRYGSDLLRNRSNANSLLDFVVSCPVCDVGTPLERVVEAFSEESASDGVIIVESGEYVGFLSSSALLRLVHEHNLANATDQNPLTRLPGNAAIGRHIESLLERTDEDHVLAYLDFDFFKPFNDCFGFRQGDRAILMFSERLKVLAATHNGFAGHIGGDDFFLALSGIPEAAARERLLDLIGRFRSDAESLYDTATRDNGFFLGKDRDGHPRRFPMLSVSGAALVLPAGQRTTGLEAIANAIATHKPAAKLCPDKLHMFRL